MCIFSNTETCVNCIKYTLKQRKCLLVHSSMGGEKKKTEGNPEHALFPAYYFSASAALGVLPLVDLSHLNARVASGKSGAAVFPSKQRARSRCCEHGDRSSSRDRCTQKRPLREHPPLHRRVPGGLPAVSRDRGGGPWPAVGACCPPLAAAGLRGGHPAGGGDAPGGGMLPACLLELPGV